MKAPPKFASVHAYLSTMLALAGRKDDAIRRPCARPSSSPSRRRPGAAPNRSSISRRPTCSSASTDKAIDTLERLLKMPYYMTPAWLAVDPTYDSLRKNPRFQKLVAPAKG